MADFGKKCMEQIAVALIIWSRFLLGSTMSAKIFSSNTICLKFCMQISAMRLKQIYIWLKISKGYGVCLIEYRRVGIEGGGWPGTNDDIVKALEKMSSVINEKNEDRKQKVVLLGHSAGGTLASWISCKMNEINGVPIALCVAVAPIGDLEAGYDRKLSDEGDAVFNYMGCAPVVGDRNCVYK